MDCGAAAKLIVRLREVNLCMSSWVQFDNILYEQELEIMRGGMSQNLYTVTLKKYCSYI